VLMREAIEGEDPVVETGTALDVVEVLVIGGVGVVNGTVVDVVMMRSDVCFGGEGLARDMMKRKEGKRSNNSC